MEYGLESFIAEGGRSRIAATVAILSATTVGVLVIPDSKSTNIVYSQGYFGEPLVGLSIEQKASFERGELLFSRNWKEASSFRRNAVSCVACHSVPMAGGAGMSNEALVLTKMAGNRTHVLQRYNSPSSTREGGVVRRTPPLFGIGFLENSALVLADGTKKPIFGAFLERNSLEDVIASALANELGVSSSRYCARKRNQNTNPKTCKYLINNSELTDLVQFVRFLAPPPKKSHSSVFRGEQIFKKMQCVQCHTPTLPTVGKISQPFLAHRVLAYTDLLRHDLGNGAKIKTAPLWGVTSVGPPYMHDAAASSIEEAILRHKGEALESSRRYKNLTSSEKEALLLFLKSI